MDHQHIPHHIAPYTEHDFGMAGYLLTIRHPDTGVYGQGFYRKATEAARAAALALHRLNSGENPLASLDEPYAPLPLALTDDALRVPVARWQEALDIQNACNLSGLVQSLPGVLSAVQQEAYSLKEGTAYVNGHPLVKLWLDKLCDLAGLTVQQGPVLEAYKTALAHGAVLR